MCSLLLAWGVIGGSPIALAANRDEATDRPATGPRLLCADPKVIAPVDERAGGTWLGVNENGLVVAIANRRDGPVGERSRGHLVRDVLTADTADEARTFLASILGEHAYAGFHLLIVDPADAFYVAWDGTLDGYELDHGVHVLDNEGLNEGADIPRTVRGQLEVHPGETADAWLARAVGVLADHDLGLCHHGDDYGTVSASTVAVSNEGEPAVSFRYADGPPCEATFEEVTLA
ncbi:MAG: NRDE family protein [Halobacteriales archaeon]